MILSAQTIRARKIITPHHERSPSHGMTFGLGPAGYDVRVAETMILHPDEFWLASTVEHFDMPSDLLATIHDKSTWARRGLAVQTTVVEPGWRGHLTLEISNHGGDAIEITAGMPIAQVVFHVLDMPTELPYTGKYQDQEAGPQEARYLAGPTWEDFEEIPL